MDADQYSKELIKPKSNCYKKVLAYFGPQIVDNYSSEDEIDRTLLKKIIFENSIHRTWIQNLLHPLIKEKMIEECNLYINNKLILLVIPLLFEAKFEDICTEIWLVKCDKEKQIKRLVQRDNICETDAYKIINLQSNFTIIDTEDQIRLIKNICKAENIDVKKLAPRYILAIIDNWKNIN